MSERVTVGLAVLFSVPFVGSAIALIGLVAMSAITGEPAFTIDAEH